MSELTLSYKTSVVCCKRGFLQTTTSKHELLPDELVFFFTELDRQMYFSLRNPSSEILKEFNIG